METEHTQNVVDKALAFVKHTLGIPSVDQTPEVVAKPEYTDTAPVTTIEGAMQFEPHTRILKIGPETNAERRADESANSAVDEHMQTAGKLHRAEWSAQKALGEIQDISRDMREKFVDATGTKDILSAAERHLILSRPGGSVGRMTPLEAGRTGDDAIGLDPYTFKSVGELHIEKAANDDGTKEHSSPAELHADGPMT